VTPQNIKSLERNTFEIYTHIPLSNTCIQMVKITREDVYGVNLLIARSSTLWEHHYIILLHKIKPERNLMRRQEDTKDGKEAEEAALINYINCCLASVKSLKCGKHVV